MFNFILFVFPSHALTPEQVTQITQVYSKKTLSERISYFSDLFLAAPYEFDALGEGDKGMFSQKPCYRFDRFDCQSYVDTVLALAFSSNFSDFQRTIIQLGYQGDRPDFFDRNHFPEVDWIAYNLSKKYLINITSLIAAPSQQLQESVLIDRKKWYQLLPESRLFLPGATKKVYQQKLFLLHEHAQKEKAVRVTLSIIPSALVPVIIKSIPHAAVILIVRPISDKKASRIGTSILISHMGFAIWRNQQLYFRAASSMAGHVQDCHLLSYLQTYKTIKGIIVLMPQE